MASTHTTQLQVGDITIGYSYAEPVAAFVPGLGAIKRARKFSVTSSKHANTFCREWNGLGPNQTLNETDFFAAIGGVPTVKILK